MFFALKVTAGNDDAKEAKSRVQVSVGYPEELDFVLCNRPSLAIIRECSSLVHAASRPLAPIGCHQFLKADAPEPMFAPPTPTDSHYRLMPSTLFTKLRPRSRPRPRKHQRGSSVLPKIH